MKCSVLPRHALRSCRNSLSKVRPLQGPYGHRLVRLVDSIVPTVLRVGGYRFFFFSNEREEPVHIDVEQGERYAKFWVEPISLARNSGFRSGELRELHRLIDTHRRLFSEKWNEHFSR